MSRLKIHASPRAEQGAWQLWACSQGGWEGEAGGAQMHTHTRPCPTRTDSCVPPQPTTHRFCDASARAPAAHRRTDHIHPFSLSCKRTPLPCKSFAPLHLPSACAPSAFHVHVHPFHTRTARETRRASLGPRLTGREGIFPYFPGSCVCVCRGGVRVLKPKAGLRHNQTKWMLLRDLCRHEHAPARADAHMVHAAPSTRWCSTQWGALRPPPCTRGGRGAG